MLKEREAFINHSHLELRKKLPSFEFDAWVVEPKDFFVFEKVGLNYLKIKFNINVFLP